MLCVVNNRMEQLQKHRFREALSPGRDKFQFVRVGYFCCDSKNTATFNRIVGLKDSFPKN